MPLQDIRVPSLLGGVSRVSQNGRMPHEFENGINIELYPDRGADKRPGTEYIAAAGTAQGQLNLTGTDYATHTPYIFWIHRDSGERYVCFINPNFNDENILQVFNIDGTKQTVVGPDGVNNLGHSSADEIRAYLTSGSGDFRRRYRHLTVEDTTFLLNRSVATALTGGPITYRNSGNPANVRNRNNPQNVPSWSDFDHPPTVDDANLSIPVGSPSDPNVNVDDDGLWYAREDDVGQPSGFYHAVSATQPPWFRRVRTEGKNSVINASTMPIRMSFDGTKFIVSQVDWTPRLSGDSTSNPGPTFIGNPISDMAFHQGRLWFVSGERIVSSRLNDIFNLWVDSVSLQTDSDPIDTSLFGNRFSSIDFLATYREALIALTSGSRQVEIRANGPITPSSIMMFDSTNIFTVDYVKPVKLGSQLYFMGERDFANVVWEYLYSPDSISNIATEVTQRVIGYIPAQASLMVASEAHDQLFILTDAQPDRIYVNKMRWEGSGKKSMNSWYEWRFGREIMSIEVFDDYLYLIFRDTSGPENLIFIERMPLGHPKQDTDGDPAQTLSYAVRIDRKYKVTGVFDGDTNTTTWTVPFRNNTLDEVVLAATWDEEDTKMAGTRLEGFTVTPGSTTTVTISGDYSAHPVYVGNSYEASIDLSEQFVRDQNMTPMHGNTTLLRGKIRHRDAAYYYVEITPPGRSPLKKEFVVPFIETTPLDSNQLDPFGEFQFRIMAPTRKTRIRLVNDAPTPAAWIDMEFAANWNPAGFSPIK